MPQDALLKYARARRDLRARLVRRARERIFSMARARNAH